MCVCERGGERERERERENVLKILNKMKRDLYAKGSVISVQDIVVIGEGVSGINDKSIKMVEYILSKNP